MEKVEAERQHALLSNLATPAHDDTQTVVPWTRHATVLGRMTTMLVATLLWWVIMVGPTIVAIVTVAMAIDAEQGDGSRGKVQQVINTHLYMLCAVASLLGVATARLLWKDEQLLTMRDVLSSEEFDERDDDIRRAWCSIPVCGSYCLHHRKRRRDRLQAQTTECVDLCEWKNVQKTLRRAFSNVVYYGIMGSLWWMTLAVQYLAHGGSWWWSWLVLSPLVLCSVTVGCGFFWFQSMHTLREQPAARLPALTDNDVVV